MNRERAAHPFIVGSIIYSSKVLLCFAFVFVRQNQATTTTTMTTVTTMTTATTGSDKISPSFFDQGTIWRFCDLEMPACALAKYKALNKKDSKYAGGRKIAVWEKLPKSSSTNFSNPKIKILNLETKFFKVVHKLYL